jgi:hypothetical protein
LGGLLQAHLHTNIGEEGTVTIGQFKLEILKQEIEIVHEKINHFDNLRHQTRQMAVTLWLAAVGVGLTAKQPLILYLAAFVPLPLWYFESIYHAYQEGYSSRARAVRAFLQTGRYAVQGHEEVSLEECFNAPDFGAFPVPDYFGGRTVPKEEHRKGTSVLRNFVKIKMVLFYLPLVLAALLFVLFV